MSPPDPSAPRNSRPWPTSATPGSSLREIRDRDYLLDRHGIIFKVIGDVHPETHYLGYVKYYPDDKGDRRLFGKTYRQNSVVSKSFGILAGRPECYIYSPVLGCVITGLPRHDTVTHYSCRQVLAAISENPGLVQGAQAGQDLLAIIGHIIRNGHAHLFGVTGSFLTGCFTARSDIDLVCYGPAGYDAAQALFQQSGLIRQYAGGELTQLYLRRARYMAGSDFASLIKQELRKFQGLTAVSGAHINCEPIRSDDDRTFTRMYAKEVGDVTLLATITGHAQGLATPALYQIEVQNILTATIDEPAAFTTRITCLRSYLGAYTGAFRAGDVVYIAGKLVHIQDGDYSSFGVELTPWNVSTSYLASLAR